VIQLDRATEVDIPFIMATERLPGYEALVGRWDDARHRAAMTDGRHAYFVGRREGSAIGFLIIRDWNSPEQVSLLKRIAVAQPGEGNGKELLRAALDAVFEQTNVHRLWIGVFPENERARRAYEGVGFVAEGVARGSAFFGGTHRDELTLSILRPEWAERR